MFELIGLLTGLSRACNLYTMLKMPSTETRKEISVYIKRTLHALETRLRGL
jgi:hypothetical protein